MSIQQRKTGKKFFLFDEISRHFEIPEAVAATHLGISKTQLKKLCREHDVPRWPYRRLKSLQSKIDVLRCQCEKTTIKEEIDLCNKQISELQMKKEFIKQNPKSISVVPHSNNLAFTVTHTFIPKSQKNESTPTNPSINNNIIGSTRTPKTTVNIPPNNFQSQGTSRSSPSAHQKSQSFEFSISSDFTENDVTADENSKKRPRAPIHVQTMSEPIPVFNVSDTSSTTFECHRRTKSDTSRQLLNNPTVMTANGTQKSYSQSTHYHLPLDEYTTNENKRRKIVLPEVMDLDHTQTQAINNNRIETPSSASFGMSRLGIGSEASEPYGFVDTHSTTDCTLPSFSSFLQEIDKPLH
ncbi:hypothetical protein AKO1_011280 [Acrasis kona]|uniref:RWP-RK domain-containing protein n=1 Tax=Acrasis kona TaxID=1008807 RepID=A0AAW2YWM4_9EUKA